MSKDITDELIIREETSGYSFEKSKGDIQEELKELKEENKISKNITSQLMSDFINKNVIPVSLVEEKIEELKQERTLKYDNYMGHKIESREQQDIDKKVQVLQELLERR